MKIAIIGAGLAGLILASRLAGKHEIVVLEKARGPGGRMSTRRAAPFAFDHGAQYFTAETRDFQAHIQTLLDQDQIAIWPDQIQLAEGARVSDKPKYVAQPGMNAICKALAERLDLRTQTRADRLERTPSGWLIHLESGPHLGPFDWVISTAPSVQTAQLMPITFAGQERLQHVQMAGCYALMLGFDEPLDLQWTALKSAKPPIGWMAVNSNKPGRTAAFSLLVQSNNVWADAHIDDPQDEVAATLLAAASALAGADLSAATHQVLHRWRYAATPQPAGVPYLLDERLQLAACGDWCLGSKVEAAYRSASALADSLLTLPKT
ncbi:MAG: FAD-dependent oxidoreductase [Pseudomonadota bacterium]